MTVAQNTPTLQDDFADLKRRIYALEQGRSGNYASDGSAVFPGGITVGDSAPVFVDEGVGTPSGLQLSWGSFFDVIFIDASWTAGGGQTQEYEVELVKAGQGVAQIRRTGGTNVRFEPVEPNTQYQVRVRAISRIGVYSAFTGYTSITTGEDSSVPGQVTGLTVAAAFRTMTIRWTERTEVDMVDNRGYYEVQIDTVNTFNSGNLRTVRVAGIITTFADLSTSTTYFVRVRAIDSSGNFGAYSTTASATTAQILNAADLAADVVTTVQLADNAVNSANIVDAAIITAKIASLAVAEANIANAAITNAKIASLAVDDAKIANISAGKITTSTLTATITISGTIYTGAANPRVIIDSAGIRLVDSGGRTTLDIAQGAGQPLIKLGRVSSPFHYQILDSAGIRFFKNGSAPFTGGTLGVDLNVNTGSITVDGGTITGTAITGGSFRTASSGRRVTIDSADFNVIRFFSGGANENSSDGHSRVAAFQDGGSGQIIWELLGPIYTGVSDRVRIVLWSGSASNQTFLDVNAQKYKFNIQYAGDDREFLVEGGRVHARRPGDGGGFDGKSFMATNTNGGGDVRGGYSIYLSAHGYSATLGLLNFQGYKVRVADAGETFHIPMLASGYEVSSAQRYKKDIRSLETSLSKLRQLRPVRFKPAGMPTRVREEEYGPPDLPGGERRRRRIELPPSALQNSQFGRDRIGLIAEEVEAIIPEAVGYVEGADGTLIPDSLDYMQLVPLLIQAYQNMANRLEVLESRGPG